MADTRASESAMASASDQALKNWILPTANEFIKDESKHYKRPEGNPGSNFPLFKTILMIMIGNK
uniref:CAZy families GH2 protein n=1 Tax=uncultured Cellvibrio sp. TaxID=174586 RepID=A0A060CL21_9GAMM|nr:CAZy families GH2 protein [uncultured Cellvibrio sp.]